MCLNFTLPAFEYCVSAKVSSEADSFAETPQYANIRQESIYETCADSSTCSKSCKGAVAQMQKQVVRKFFVVNQEEVLSEQAVKGCLLDL